MSLPDCPLDQRSDEELIGEFVRGGCGSTTAAARAFDALFLRYEHNIRDFHAIRWPEHAEEMTQDTFVRVLRFAERYDPRKGAFKNWLYTVAKSARLDYCKQHRLAWEAEVQVEFPYSNLEPIQPGSRPEDIIRVKQLIRCLPPLDREIIFLYYVVGHTDKEIAQIVAPRRFFSSLTAKGVATRRTRALQQLGIVEERR